MKKYLLFLACFLCLFLNAQQHIDTGVASQTNTVFSLLDKNRVPHSMLLDYGYDFVQVTNYDGVLRSNNYISPSIYRDLYNSVLSMRTSTSVPELVAPDVLEATWKSEIKGEANRAGKGGSTSALVLNGLYYKYSKIRSNALSQNDIRILSNKYDDVFVNGTWQNPYETKETFALTVPVRAVSNSQVSLLLENDVWYTNQNSSVHSFAVNFGDGSGYKTLTIGTPLNHGYNADGTYTWTFRLRLTNGQYRYSRSKIKVTGSARQQSLTARNPACGIAQRSVAATRSFQGTRGSATLQIAYAGTCGELRKPLIVAEGLDTGLLADNGSIGDSDIENFFRSVINSNSNNLRNLITNNTANDFDIIYVNWDNGTDYLQRNAFVLQEVIDWVNANKIGSTPNVVLGQSMGGVIARYALKDMEDRSEPHDTSLYISHDAPHQGAHVPPGFLYMARHVLNEIITTPVGGVGVAVASGDFPASDAKKLIDQPAVKQLLINYVDNNYNLDNSEFSSWQNALRSKGYPQQTRNVALSNGSHCADTYGISSNQRLFRLNGSAATSPLTEVVLFFTGLGSVPGFALGDTAAGLLGFLPGASKLSVDFQVRAFPSSGSARIYQGKITYKKTLLWVVGITRTITDRAFNSQSGLLSFDNFPGGENPTFSTIEEDSDYQAGFLGGYNYNIEVTTSVNFVPTTSALDVGSGNTSLNTSDYLRAYAVGTPTTGNRTIPYDNYTTSYSTSGENETHLSFNARNGNWLADELDNSASQFDCTYICGTPEIIGSSTLCTQDTYTVDVFGDAQVQWTSSHNNVAWPVNPNSTTTSFMTPANSYRQNVTITATITSNDCGGPPVVLNKTIWVGRPGTPSSLTGPTTVNTGALVTYNGGVAAGATSYEWRLPYPFDRVSQFDYIAGNWQIHNSTTYRSGAQMFTGYDKNSGYVQLMGKNRCGTGGARLLSVSHRSSGGSGGGGPRPIGGGGIPLTADMGSFEEVPSGEQGVVMYPNQATDEVHLEVINSSVGETDWPTKIHSIKIYPQFQNMIKKELNFGKVGASSVLVDLRDISSGYYIMAVETDHGMVYKVLLKK